MDRDDILRPQRQPDACLLFLILEVISVPFRKLGSKPKLYNETKSCLHSHQQSTAAMNRFRGSRVCLQGISMDTSATECDGPFCNVPRSVSPLCSVGMSCAIPRPRLPSRQPRRAASQRGTCPLLLAVTLFAVSLCVHCFDNPCSHLETPEQPGKEPGVRGQGGGEGRSPGRTRMLHGLGWDGAMTESLGASLVTLTIGWQTSGGAWWPSRDKGPG